jgi:hypothetical protein
LVKGDFDTLKRTGWAERRPTEKVIKDDHTFEVDPDTNRILSIYDGKRLIKLGDPVNAKSLDGLPQYSHGKIARLYYFFKGSRGFKVIDFLHHDSKQIVPARIQDLYTDR